jgi:hypothetical protein
MAALRHIDCSTKPKFSKLMYARQGWFEEEDNP